MKKAPKYMQILAIPVILIVFGLFGTGISMPSAVAAPPPVTVKGAKCVKCGKEIKPGENFLKTADGKIFCSEKCFQASLPTCCICGKILSGSFYKGKDGKSLYCSEKCLSTTWMPCASCGKKVPEGMMVTGPDGKKFFCNICADRPRCFCCDMPAKCSKLEDGRFICPECSKTSVMEEPEIIAVAKEVRQKMKSKLNLSTDHQIEFKIVGLPELSRMLPEKQEGMELGLFRFEERSDKTISSTTNLKGETVTKVEDERITRKYTIYLLYGMTRDKLVEVAAHELGHDWMQANYPKISDLKIKEGFAEYVASQVNAAYGREYLNKRMQDNPAEKYGGGYRFIAEIAKKGDDDLKAFLEKYNRESGGK